MIESLARSRERRYHKRKLALVFAAMRGFADDLRAAGWSVDYYSEREDFETPLAEHIAQYRPAGFAMMAQSEYGVTQRMVTAVAAHGVQCDVLPHGNFVSAPEDFARFFIGGRQRVTMEHFYRWMRRKTGLLMDGDEPAGGIWNCDRQNRRPPPRNLRPPKEPTVPLRPRAREAIALVERHFAGNPGTLADFDIPTTRADALEYANDFFANRLKDFGAYEDAMLRGERRLYHSRLSASLNIGLLHPLELCERAELAYRTGTAPLQSVEGFVRQLIGWREFVWQTYWRLMPEYRARNALAAHAPVPAAYDDGLTDMLCIREAMRSTLELGWAHHILRLMVLGNFALLVGVEPQAMTDWFWEMFVDGYDWVMVPNVVGMALHADGGFVGTKPYAAAANYINRMSDYCGACRYDPKRTVAADACPYNALYWDFLGRHEKRFEGNPRMQLTLRAWRAKDEPWRSGVRERARMLRETLADGGRL